MPSRLHILHTDSVYLDNLLPPFILRRQRSAPLSGAKRIPLYYTLRLLGGLQPLCGSGVTSLMRLMLNPAACRDLNAASLPAPGPFINTSTVLTPLSIAFFAANSAATWAANGVPFLEPLKPCAPELDHAMTFPAGSVMLTIVLLKVDFIWATPLDTALFSFLAFAI